MSFLTAIQTFVQQQHSQSLQEVYSWILGRLGVAGWHDVALVAPYIVASVGRDLPLPPHRSTCSASATRRPRALGIDVRRTRLAIVLFATIGTAAAVAVSGLIGFVGIIVPHAIRLTLGTSYRLIIPLSVLFGGGFLSSPTSSRAPWWPPRSCPIGVVTAFCGAPFFAIVLRTSRSFS